MTNESFVWLAQSGRTLRLGAHFRRTKTLARRWPARWLCAGERSGDECGERQINGARRASSFALLFSPEKSAQERDGYRRGVDRAADKPACAFSWPEQNSIRLVVRQVHKKAHI